MKTSKKRSTWMTRIRRGLMGGVLLLLALEALLRVRFDNQLDLHSIPQIYEDDPVLGYRYRPSARGHIAYPDIRKDFELNSKGYYGPEFELEKPSGVFRIAVVDSSQATGIWLASGDPFGQLLEELFDDTDHDVEVLNFSIDGANRDMAMVLQIETEILEYAPDLVLAHLELPLPASVPMRDRYRGYVYRVGMTHEKRRPIEVRRRRFRSMIDEIESHPMTRVYDACYLVRAACRFVDRWTDSQLAAWMVIHQYKTIWIDYEIPVLSEMETMLRLRRCARRVADAGGRLLLFDYADAQPYDFAHWGLDHVAFGIPWNDEQLTNVHEEHFNHEGHRYVAERFFEVVQERYLDTAAANE